MGIIHSFGSRRIKLFLMTYKARGEGGQREGERERKGRRERKE